MIDINRYFRAIDNADLVQVIGKVVKVVGLVVEAQVQGVSVGELCNIELDETHNIQAEVVGFKEGRVLLMPLGTTGGIKPGSKISATGYPIQVKVGDGLLGRILDGLGRPIDQKGELIYQEKYSVDRIPPDPVMRPRINKVFKAGVKAVDGLLTLGRGQRIGIFAGSGVGKSTLLGMLARNCEADVNVISLIGERGREVKDFIEESLGEEGLKKSVVICATSDTPPLIRMKGALVGTAIAEYFRDQGKNVLFMMDSVTRFAMAQREIGLATGEPPTTKGYTPSVFALLPRLMERAGTSEKGIITAIYTVLVEGGDMDEPIADTSRSILDGHMVLSRDLAAKNHYPCIDINHSVSRLFPSVSSDEHKKAAGKLREVLAKYREAEDLINIGAYVQGSNPKIDHAIEKIDAINTFLIQGTHENVPFDETIKELINIFET
ncbi:flagellar protein export ATPase FliI [bacterium]|jgi:flagellum-specific ATP synthase|nr:flagellar protein export ATPase FliI [bacterium]MBT3582099.1 flagellar protein export ATPase FliI [bacterium]MBT4552167.1 flagellar protein export ATPase FliI [bacterium]MBT7087820.1 flagellar protein export ATPase FliI [bacterium]